MTATTTPSPGQQALAALQTWAATLGVDAASAILTPLNAFGASLVATPTETNLIAQGPVLVLAGAAALPQLTSEAIAATGTAIQSLVVAAQSAVSNSAAQSATASN